MNQHITFLLPSKSRPEKFFATLDNIIELSVSENFEVIGVFDREDTTMNNDEVKQRVATYHPNTLRTYYDNSTGKIDACNRCIKNIQPFSEIICLASDDFRFTKKGFDNDIRLAYADGFAGVCHFPDGRVDNEPKEKHATGFYIWMNLHAWTFSMIGNGGYVSPNFEGKYTLPALYKMYYTEQNKRLITFPIMHKEYLAIDGWIYHPRFKSVCSDDFQTELAKKRGQYRYVDKNIMEHRHYRNGFGEPDALMLHNDSGDFYKHDREVLNELREEFGL